MADPRTVVDAFGFEEAARAALPESTFALIAGGDREAFDRITFRPRVGVSTERMDLGARLCGHRLHTPILVGPLADPGRFHPDAERVLIRGASRAHTPVVLSDRSGVPIHDLVPISNEPTFVAIRADRAAARRAREAADAGAAGVFVTMPLQIPNDASETRAWSPQPMDWDLISAIPPAVPGVPTVLKGVTSPADAARAVEMGFAGIVVSGHRTEGNRSEPVLELPEIVRATGGEVPTLAEGGFRRGTDVLKALILGADAVLLCRPVAWALASHGEQGVECVLELIQNELARSIGMLGVSTPAELTRDHIRVHRLPTD